MKNSETNPVRLPVRFVKQGGNVSQGLAVGRKGSQTLIAYTIADGSPRERWIPKGRVLELQGERETLPLWRTKTCKGTKLAKPVRSKDLERTKCAACGRFHGRVHRREVIRTYLTKEEVGKMVAQGDSRLVRRENADTGTTITLLYRGDASGYGPEFKEESIQWVDGWSSLKLEDELVG